MVRRGSWMRVPVSQVFLVKHPPSPLCHVHIRYVRGARSPSGKQLGVMFLVEAALGQEHSITKDDWTIKAPPPGFDSVVARGQQVSGGGATVDNGAAKRLVQLVQVSTSAAVA